MTLRIHQLLVLMFLIMTGLILFACERGPKKEAKLVVTDQQFLMHIVKDNPQAYVIDAKGKVKNIGNADAKKAVVTGDCLSCGEQMLAAQWFTSKNDEKSDAQKCIIGYIPAGAEAEFHFEDVALLYNNVPRPPEKMPDKMEVVIASFETVK
ncbi:MAG: hypothetical protein Q7U02_04440 [Desulfosalsimonadaceae bacterium]|nr:hypothetical protein [Desulfosalsimonadaceae bacterium]